ncbi:MAG TPA: nuclear transport factor 2 family protein [bacterium]|nr:nuclear transport factor 2 family protein [bacterium]
MNREDALQFCSRWLGAWTGNRPEELIGFYAEDAFYLDPARPEGIKGRERMLAYFKKLLAANPEWRWRALEVFPADKGFTLKWEAQVPVKGRELALRGLDIVEIKDGKITRNEVYFDRSEWIKLLKD